jgi:DNA uptake protein ComE-like DNA-binding protein
VTTNKNRRRGLDVQAHSTIRALIGSALMLATVSTLAAGPAASAALAPHGHASAPAAKKPAAKPIDLNNATKAQLQTLTGIGEAEADKIIASRPYSSKADIVTKAGLPAGVYVAIRRQIFVGKVAKPKSKA